MRDIGDDFEQQAADWLERKGWRLLARNFRTPMGELDIVALDGRSLVFVEVKARSGSRFAGAAAAVDRSKQRKLLRAARAFLQRRPALKNHRCRFDVIAFEPRQSQPGHRLNWIRAAFSE